MSLIYSSKGKSLTKVYAKGKAPCAKPPSDTVNRTQTLTAKSTRQVEEEMETVAEGTTFSWQHIIIPFQSKVVNYNC